jgi:hypothetical protein
VSADRSRLVDLVGVLVGQNHLVQTVGRIAEEVGKSNWILFVSCRAGYIDHLEERHAHILLVLAQFHIVPCYAAMKSGRIELVMGLESCKSFGYVVELRILLRLGAVMEVGIGKRVGAVQTAYRSQVVRCRYMFHLALW